MAKKIPLGIRSGRFKTGVTAPATDIKLVDEMETTIYRVLNSGANPFFVTIKATGGVPIEIPSKGCVDVYLGKDPLVVKKAALIEGIYDTPALSSEGRSGRFRVRHAESPETPRKIIDLSEANAGLKVVYRFFNTGDGAIELLDNEDPMAATLNRPLLSKQSADVLLRGKTSIYVRSTTSLGGGKFEAMSGIFDLISTR